MLKLNNEIKKNKNLILFNEEKKNNQKIGGIQLKFT